MDENGNTQRPFARACIRTGRVTLNPWNPRMIRGGPMAMHMRRVRAALVDLFQVDEDELIVEPVARSRFSSEDAGVIVAWARRVGYRRVWLPDEVIELEGEPAGGAAKVLCRSCGARWEDESHNFWLRVREQGHFPGYCPACGGSLPEWELSEPAGDRREPQSAEEQEQLDFGRGLQFSHEPRFPNG